MQNFSIRRATKADASLVAWTVLTALDLDDTLLERALASCRREDTMYSWRNAFVALADGEPVGALVAYDGGRYLDLRRRTWPALWGVEEAEFAHAALETSAGEFYLDSLALRPAARGLHFGERLISAALEQGRALGLRQAALIVDVDKPRLREHYARLGFRADGEIVFFGHRYDRMTLEL